MLKSRNKNFIPTLYVDELDHIDAFKEGVKCRADDGNVVFDNPVNLYRAENEAVLATLQEFCDKFEDGYFIESHRIQVLGMEKRLEVFKTNIPELGAVGYIEFDSNKGNYFKSRVECITPESDGYYVISLEEGADNGVGRAVGRGTVDWVTWYYEKPNL